MSDYLALGLVSLALFISVCLNVILCIRQQGTCCRVTQMCCHEDSLEGNTQSEVERQDVCDLNHREEQESPYSHHVLQENPIYGNISTDQCESTEVCYEIMSLQRTRACMKPLEPDLNYASLDLKLAKKRKNEHHLQGQAQAKHQNQLLDTVTPAENTFSEVDTEVDALLPPRDSSTMVSHSSIYLNSQQIAHEVKEMERKWSVSKEKERPGWDGLQKCEEGGNKECDRDQECEERKDNDNDASNGNVCEHHLEVENTSSQICFSGDCD